MECAINVENVSFSYDGRKNAVSDASFYAPKEGITALIGPNGSGKSTLLKLILGIYESQSGKIKSTPDPRKERDAISYSPEVYALFPHSNVMEYLMLAGQLRGMRMGESRTAAANMLKSVNLEHLKKCNTHTLSKGNRQKIQLIACLVSRPKLAVFDEPWSGLDPENQEQMATLIIDAANAGSTILLTGHHMGMIERTCHRIVAMRNGSVVISGTTDELLKRLLPTKKLFMSFSKPVHHRPQNFGGFRSEWDTLSLTANVEVPSGADMSPLITAASACGEIVDISTEIGTLHDAYIALYKDIFQDNEDA